MMAISFKDALSNAMKSISDKSLESARSRVQSSGSSGQGQQSQQQQAEEKPEEQESERDDPYAYYRSISATPSSGSRPTNSSAETMKVAPNSENAARTDSDSGVAKEAADIVNGLFQWFTGKQGAYDGVTDEMGGFDQEGTVTAEGDNDSVAVINGLIDDAIESGDMFGGVDFAEYDVDPDSVDWGAIAYAPADINVYGQIYGTDTVYDADGNAYTVLSDAAHEARANDLAYLYGLDATRDIFGDNWTQDRDEFQKHYDEVVGYNDLISNLDQIGYQYIGGDDAAIRELSEVIAALNDPEAVGLDAAYADDPEAYMNALDAILANATMESAGLNDIIAAQNGEYEGDMTIDQLRDQAASRLGWAQGDLNALMDNEQLEYKIGDGPNRNTSDHRGDAIADQYSTGADDEWLENARLRPEWGTSGLDVAVPVQNQADAVFAIYNGMSY